MNSPINNSANKTKKQPRLSKLAQCIRKTATTAKMPRKLLPDAMDVRPETLSPGLSATLTRLLQQIRELDEADLKAHGTLFKHFIFTDIRESAYGAKAIATFLMSGGFELRMHRVTKHIRRGGKLVETQMGDTLYTPKPAVPHGSASFAILQSLPLWKNPLTVQTKKRILTEFNKRPENSHGELLRIIVLDSKFKEGIDLFDVKYVHLMEPPIATSDLKQAVGRATRFCGQKGLPFTPRSGWPLHVFLYNPLLPPRAPFLMDGVEGVREGVRAGVRAHDLMMHHSGLDVALLALTQELTILAIQTAVDYELNYKINNFKIEEALLAEEGAAEGAAARPLFPEHPLPAVLRPFERFRWTAPRIQNGCDAMGGEKGKAAVFTKTQDFLRHYLTPARPQKGILAWHSVGTGKTCMAIATATTEFEQAGYTILWVTRNALMADVYKNIFETVCSIPFMKAGTVFPTDRAKQKSMLSKAWLPPISYKTFQNALEGKNELGRRLHRANPTDPLRKVFLVIDEIHKLQDGDLSATEAADFHAIQSHIHKSYAVSGADSVRPLLMTATPITKSPEELFDILNTLIPDDAHRFPPLKEFRDLYSKADGSISEDGRRYFKTHAKGLISYLNREFDPTTFAQPIFHTISVPIQDSVAADIPSFIDTYLSRIGLDSLIAEDIQEQDCDKDLREALKLLDDQITKVERELVGAEKSEKAALKSRILDIRQLMADAKLNHASQRAKCILKNKEYAKAEAHTRISAMTKLIQEMEKEYMRGRSSGSSGASEQVLALEGCLGFKQKVDSTDFIKEATRRILPAVAKAKEEKAEKAKKAKKAKATKGKNKTAKAPKAPKAPKAAKVTKPKKQTKKAKAKAKANASP